MSNHAIGGPGSAPGAGNAELEQECARLRLERARLRKTMEVLRDISVEMDLDILLAIIMEQATEVASADRSSLFLYDDATDELYSLIAQGLDTSEIRFPAGRGLAGYVVRTGRTLNIADAYDDPRFNREWDDRTGYRTRSVLAVPMRTPQGKVTGVLQVLNKQGASVFGPEDEETLGALATNAAVFVENARLHERIEQLFEAFVRVSISCIDERDPATSGHSARVAAYTVNLARLVHEDQSPRFAGVRFTRDELRELRYAGLLHDYGKIGVRESVLCKANKLTDVGLGLVLTRLEREMLASRLTAPDGGSTTAEAPPERLGRLQEYRELVCRVNVPGTLAARDGALLDRMLEERLLTAEEHEALSVRSGNLTRAEWEDMRSHVGRSYEILRQMPWPESLARLPEISYCHHEKLDGSGYPRGLQGDAIQLAARLLCVADIYDAITASDRPYKKAMEPEEAFAVLREEAGRNRLDPDLVTLFIEGGAWKIEGVEKGALLAY